jgi:hypothetical protein
MYGQGTRRRKDRCIIKTAQLRYQKGRQSYVEEKRQESISLRTMGRMFELHG